MHLEQLSAPWAKAAIVVLAAVALTTCLLGVLDSEVTARQFHWLHRVYDDARAGSTHHPAAPGVSASYSTTLDLLALVQLATLVVVAVWQFRAATAARLLGLAAARSPGWGVAGWFIPVVNLWFPYQAVRDCLPPGDPARSTVLQWWLAWLFGGFCGAAAVLAAPYSSTAGVVLLLGAVVLLGAAAWQFRKTVAAIARSHRRAVEAPAEEEPWTATRRTR